MGPREDGRRDSTARLALKRDMGCGGLRTLEQASADSDGPGAQAEGSLAGSSVWAPRLLGV